MTDDATIRSVHVDRGSAAVARVKAVLIGAGVVIVGLAVVAGLAAVLLRAGMPGGRRLVAAVTAAGILVAVTIGAWTGIGKSRSGGALLGGGVVPVVALGSVLLAGWPLVGSMADFRSVAIALDWIDAPNLGTGPTEALHDLGDLQADTRPASEDSLRMAETRVIETMILLSALVLASIAAGVLGAALRRQESARGWSSTTGQRLRLAIVTLVAGAGLLTAGAWPSVWATANAVVDFDQSAGPEIGVNLSEVVGHPTSMWGETVTVSATVHQLIGRHAAVIGNDAVMVGTTLLIASDTPLQEQILLAPPGRSGLEPGDVVQVTGIVRQRESADLSEGLRNVLDEVRAEDYRGQVVLVVDAIDRDVPVAAEAGDPELSGGSAAYDTGVTIDDIVHHPEAYVGLTVTVSGEVEEPILTPHVVVLSGRPLLVISPKARPELFVEATTYVRGEVRMFHLAEIEQELAIDLDDAAMRPYEGQPFILAESVRLAT